MSVRTAAVSRTPPRRIVTNSSSRNVLDRGCSTSRHDRRSPRLTSVVSHGLLVFLRKIYTNVGVLLGSILGIVIGLELRNGVFRDIEQDQTDVELIHWIDFPGTLFLRAISAMVIPLASTTLISSVADLVMAGHWIIGQQTSTSCSHEEETQDQYRGTNDDDRPQLKTHKTIPIQSSLSKYSMILFILTSVIAACEGMLWGFLYQDNFKEIADSRSSAIHRLNAIVPKFSFRCGNGKLLQQAQASSEWTCSGTNPRNNETHFTLHDRDENFQFLNHSRISFHNVLGGESDPISKAFTNRVQTLVPENLMGAYSRGNLLAVVTFSTLLGLAVARHAKASKTLPQNLMVLGLVRQLQHLLIWIFERLMWTSTPVAAMFLLISMTIRQFDEVLNMLSNMTFFIAAMCCAHLAHNLVIMPMLFGLVHHSRHHHHHAAAAAAVVHNSNNSDIDDSPNHHPSIFLHMRKMIPALVFAFGSSSSLATLPVSVWCLGQTKQTSRRLARTSLRLGSSMNMNGMALYLPIAFIFLKKTSGLAEDNGSHWSAYLVFEIIFLSVVGSFAAAPVPNTGLLMVLGMWQALMGFVLPTTFPYIVVIEWLEDRLQSVTNVLGDAFVTLLLAPILRETYQDELEERSVRRQEFSEDTIITQQ